MIIKYIGIIALVLAIFNQYLINYSTVDLFGQSTCKNGYETNYEKANVLVTGSSDGLGKEMALHYCNLGSNVILTGRSIDKLKAVAIECENKGANKVFYYNGDMNLKEFPKQLIDNILLEPVLEKRIDVLIVNHAYIPLFTSHSIIENDEEYHKVTQVNYNAAASLIIKALPLLYKAKETARVAAILSTSLFLPTFLLTHYGASKSALDYFLKGLDMELNLINKQNKIAISRVVLGEIATDSHRKDCYDTLDDGKIDLTNEAMSITLTPFEASKQTVCAIDKRLAIAQVPTSMYWLSFLGYIRPLLPILTKVGFISKSKEHQAKLKAAEDLSNEFLI